MQNLVVISRIKNMQTITFLSPLASCKEVMLFVKPMMTNIYETSQVEIGNVIKLYLKIPWCKVMEGAVLK